MIAIIIKIQVFKRKIVFKIMKEIQTQTFIIIVNNIKTKVKVIITTIIKVLLTKMRLIDLISVKKTNFTMFHNKIIKVFNFSNLTIFTGTKN